MKLSLILLLLTVKTVAARSESNHHSSPQFLPLYIRTTQNGSNDNLAITSFVDST